jgi:phosphoglycerate dehydrogenase-like enzyme
MAKLPEHGVIINVARGDIIDQDALFSELTNR